MSRKFIIREKIIVFNGGGKTVMTSEDALPILSLQYVYVESVVW